MSERVRVYENGDYWVEVDLNTRPIYTAPGWAWIKVRGPGDCGWLKDTTAKMSPSRSPWCWFRRSFDGAMVWAMTLCDRYAIRAEISEAALCERLTS